MPVVSTKGWTGSDANGQVCDLDTRFEADPFLDLDTRFELAPDRKGD